MEEETISHLFYYYNHIQDVRDQVQLYFTDCFHFSHLTTLSHLTLIILIMTLFLSKITYYFHSNNIYTIPENMGFYLLTIF